MVRMTIANSNRQAISAKGILDGKKALLEELQAIVETFSATTDSLRGASYDSARDYLQQVLNPLVLGAKLYMDDLEEALNRLPTEYMEQCMMDLDEEDLRRKI